MARSTSDFHSKTASLQGRVAYLLLDGHSVEAYEMDSVTEHRAIVDTHRHPIGPKLAAKMAERRPVRPEKEFPQTNAQDLIVLSRVFRSGLRHAQAARGRRHPQPCQQWRRGGMVCAGHASSQHGRRPQVLERRIPGDQGSLSRRVRADGQRTRARRGLVGRSSRR